MKPLLLCPKLEPTDTPFEDERMETNGQPGADGDDPVVAEYKVILLRPPEGVKVERFTFEQEPPAHMNGCTARLKRAVKKAEFTYRTAPDGTFASEHTAMFDGVYAGDCHAKPGDLSREALVYFHKGCCFLLPVKDAYLMKRQVNGPTEDDLKARNKQAEDALEAMEVDPSSKPGQVTEWQKKRREQSAHYRAMLVDQDPWVDCQLKRSTFRKSYKEQMKRAKHTARARVNPPVQLPEF
ncbi:hypothetical protein M3Y99_00489300 [Aphelenchoides fujianensis]|nr:hypothetical protein M3Y99_00489300 [Aphelenchoides fujianensis]